VKPPTNVLTPYGICQKIRCIKCKEIICRMTGNGWINDAWVPCPACGIETRILQANPTGEHRPIAPHDPIQTNHRTDRIESPVCGS
jgi:phage FluMu protein Com